MDSGRRARFELAAADGLARSGTVRTPRGGFSTPCFMPVGTRGAVRTASALDLEQLGAEIALANTYHLMLRPGAETVAALGGLHRFAAWGGHLLTETTERQAPRAAEILAGSGLAPQVATSDELSATVVLYSGPWRTMTVVMFQAHT